MHLLVFEINPLENVYPKASLVDRGGIQHVLPFLGLKHEFKGPHVLDTFLSVVFAGRCTHTAYILVGYDRVRLSLLHLARPVYAYVLATVVQYEKPLIDFGPLEEFDSVDFLSKVSAHRFPLVYHVAR